MANSKPQEILDFWFGTDPRDPLQKKANWWKKNASFDEEIRQRFYSDWQKARQGDYDHWKETARPCLAYLILLDQFSRNLCRNRPEAFAQDGLAQQACLGGIHRGLDQELPAPQRVFFYMPLMHAEDIDLQKKSLHHFKTLAETGPEEIRPILKSNYEFAQRHAEIIFRFGRYPHRNQVLGRQSTPEERDFLKQPGSSF